MATELGVRCCGDFLQLRTTAQASLPRLLPAIAACHTRPLRSYSSLRPRTTRTLPPVTVLHRRPSHGLSPHCNSTKLPTTGLPSMTSSPHLPPPLTALGSYALSQPLRDSLWPPPATPSLPLSLSSLNKTRVWQQLLGTHIHSPAFAPAIQEHLCTALAFESDSRPSVSSAVPSSTRDLPPKSCR